METARLDGTGGAGGLSKIEIATSFQFDVSACELTTIEQDLAALRRTARQSLGTSNLFRERERDSRSSVTGFLDREVFRFAAAYPRGISQRINFRFSQRDEAKSRSPYPFSLDMSPTSGLGQQFRSIPLPLSTAGVHSRDGLKERLKPHFSRSNKGEKSIRMKRNAFPREIIAPILHRNARFRRRDVENEPGGDIDDSLRKLRKKEKKKQ